MTDERKSEPDWYLREWAELKGKTQTDLVNELGWAKNSAFQRWHGIQPYRRDLVNQVAKWLGIDTHELFMPPAQAEALKRLRDTAAQIVAGGAPEAAPAATAKKK